jgi:hypothetical protein
MFGVGIWVFGVADLDSAVKSPENQHPSSKLSASVSFNFVNQLKPLSSVENKYISNIL